ncbi:phosphatidate cytidylyltransferase [Mesorhizobium sp. CAU 1732]|uniref:phosphatidate cytidylyltransferase n=1 Tax=Mesorhizobium sp. CAU 1732 TaxID=3140358 RepID=UPI0032613395
MTDATGAEPGNVGHAASNLKQRVVSAIVLIAVVLALTWAGGIWYRLLCAVIAGAVFYEWSVMTAKEPGGVHGALLWCLMAIVLAALVFGASAVVMIGVIVAAIVVGAGHAAFAGGGFWPVAGLAYAGLSGLSLSLVRGDDSSGFAATLFLFAIVWSTDILAYFVGKAVGGPKLAPSISPGKTWSGAIGGTVAGIAAGLIAAMYGGAALGIAVMCLFALVLSVISQIGDLFESSLKRRFAIKDSSKLIPGHGGVMDRVDGLVAAAFGMWLIGGVVAGLETPAHAFF